MFYMYWAQLSLFSIIHFRSTKATIDSNLFPAQPLDIPDSSIKHFEFNMFINYRYTMSLYSKKWPTQGPKSEPPKTIDYNAETNSFIHRDNLLLNDPCDKTANVTDEEIHMAYKTDRFIFGAGTHRKVMTVNGRYPGPTFVVNQHSNITVYVHNELINEAFTVHFHGFRQKGTWWMDGVAGVQQCSISPGSTFVYRIYAEEAGTYWYHGHLGTESNQGLMGALVVIPADDTQFTPKQSKYVNLQYGSTITTTAQYVITFNELFTNSINEAFHATTHYRFKQFDNLNDPLKPCFFPNRSPERGGGSPVTMSDIVINGHGWHNVSDLFHHPWKIPMQTYMVKQNQSYLFRMLDVGVQVVKKLGINNHKLYVVASDGQMIKTKAVNRIASTPGERYDFVLIADQKPGTYYIMIETIETINWFTNDTVKQRYFGLARIQYKGVPLQRTPLVDIDSECGPLNLCTMLNCPWKNFAPSFHTKCVHLTDLESFEPVDKDLLLPSYQSSFEEHFIRITSFDGLNGWRFMHPKAPPYFYPQNESLVMMPCDKERCLKNDQCTCTPVLRIKFGNIIQLVIHQTHNMDRMSHPFHIHGHHFVVVAQGFPTYDEKTGYFKEQNADVECHGDNVTCFESSWKNKSWLNGNIPYLNLHNPILKDTVTVPTGGYIVIRYKADNPGWWLMHCHAVLHHTIGMAMAVQEGDNSEMTASPAGKPQCGLIDISFK